MDEKIVGFDGKFIEQDLHYSFKRIVIRLYNDALSDIWMDYLYAV